jgi:hypothetical protein
MLKWYDADKARRNVAELDIEKIAIEKIEICPTNQCKKKLRPTLVQGSQQRE